MTTGSKRKSIAFTIGGIALVIAGFVLLKFFPADEGVMEVLPYYFMGIGCGAFGWGGWRASAGAGAAGKSGAGVRAGGGAHG